MDHTVRHQRLRDRDRVPALAGDPGDGRVEAPGGVVADGDTAPDVEPGRVRERDLLFAEVAIEHER